MYLTLLIGSNPSPSLKLACSPRSITHVLHIRSHVSTFMLVVAAIATVQGIFDLATVLIYRGHFRPHALGKRLIWPFQNVHRLESPLFHLRTGTLNLVARISALGLWSSYQHHSSTIVLETRIMTRIDCSGQRAEYDQGNCHRCRTASRNHVFRLPYKLSLD